MLLNPSLAIVLQYGVAGLLFLVWVYTFKYFSQGITKVSNDYNVSVKELTTAAGGAYQTAIDDSKSLNKELITLIRENAKEELELKSHLIRTLTRIEEKLDQPVRCPAAISGRIGELKNG